MPQPHRSSRPHYVLLLLALLAVTMLFGIPAQYERTTYVAMVAALWIAVCWPAWRLGASRIRSADPQIRLTAAAGTLFVFPWITFALLAGVGPPGNQSAADNHLRYLILPVNAVAVGTGMLLLFSSFRAAGERIFCTLALAWAAVATPLYVVWASVMLSSVRALSAAPAEAVPWMRTLADASDVLLFFAGALTYGAAAAFAVSLAEVRWMRRRSATAFAVAALAALALLAKRGVYFPSPAAAFGHWYTIPGFIAGIPAVPWFVPCLLGVWLLRRAGSEPVRSTRSAAPVSALR